MKLSDLKPAKYNPRKDLTPDDIEYKKISASIEKHGFLQPLIWNERTGNLVGGHQRLKVLAAKGIKEIEVVVVDVDENQEKAMNLSLNKAVGEWDTEKLLELLKEAQEQDFLDMTCFDEDDLKELLNKVDETKQGLTDPDDAPKKRETNIKIGDIFKLGEHRLMCGDSTDAHQVAVLMAGSKADIVFTDPPYGMSLDSNPYEGGNRGTGGKSAREKSWGKLKNDELKGEAFTTFLVNSIKSLSDNSKINAPLYIWGTWRTLKSYVDAFSKMDLKMTSFIVWNKESIGLGYSNYKPQHEFLFYFSRKSVWTGGLKQGDVWSKSRGNLKEYEHPTMKPIEFCVRPIKNSSKVKDIVLDLFGGSGSTLIACEHTYRKCFMMELDPMYVQVIIDRWERFTGNKAEKISL